MRRVVFVLLLLAAPVFAQIDPRAQLLLSLSIGETIIRPVDAIAKSAAWSETNTYSDEKLSFSIDEYAVVPSPLPYGKNLAQGGHWRSAGVEATRQWIMFDLGKAARIDRAIVWPTSYYTPNNVKQADIYYSNDPAVWAVSNHPSWVFCFTVDTFPRWESVGNKGGIVNFPHPTFAARYIKLDNLIVHGANRDAVRLGAIRFIPEGVLNQ